MAVLDDRVLRVLVRVRHADRRNFNLRPKENIPVLDAKNVEGWRALRGKATFATVRRFESDPTLSSEQGQHIPRPGPNQ